MDERILLREDVSIATGLTIAALAGEPGADGVQALASASQLVDSAERALHLLVADARGQGMTWAAIGEALGISRQAAQKRFAGRVPAKVTRETEGVPDDVMALVERILDDAAAGRLERLEEIASPQLERLAGPGGIRRAFEPVEGLFGSLVERGEISARRVGRVVRATALETRTRTRARAVVVLAPDRSLLGITYDDADAAD